MWLYLLVTRASTLTRTHPPGRQVASEQESRNAVLISSNAEKDEQISNLEAQLAGRAAPDQSAQAQPHATAPTNGFGNVGPTYMLVLIDGFVYSLDKRFGDGLILETLQIECTVRGRTHLAGHDRRTSGLHASSVRLIVNLSRRPDFLSGYRLSQMGSREGHQGLAVSLKNCRGLADPRLLQAFDVVIDSDDESNDPAEVISIVY